MKTKDIIIYEKDYSVCNFLYITLLVPRIEFKLQHSFPKYDASAMGSISNEDEFQLDFPTGFRYNRDSVGYFFVLRLFGFGIKIDRQWDY